MQFLAYESYRPIMPMPIQILDLGNVKLNKAYSNPLASPYHIHPYTIISPKDT